MSHVTQEEFKIVGEATLELLNRMKALERRATLLENQVRAIVEVLKGE